MAALFRFVNLEGWPRWYIDEGFYGQTAVNLYSGILGMRGYEPNPPAPIFPIIAGALSRLFGPSYPLLRGVNAAAGVASCILVYQLGRHFWGRGAGLVAGLLLAVSFNAVYLSRLGLQTGLFEVFFLLTMLFYLKASATPGSLWAHLTGLTAGLALLTKIPGGLAAFVFVFLAALAEGKLKLWLRTIPAYLVAASGWLIIALITGVEAFAEMVLSGRGTVTSSTDFQALLSLLTTGHPDNQLHSQVSNFHVGLWATLGFIALIYVLAKNTRGDRLLLLSFVSLFAVVVGTRVVVWWILLVMVIPLYALATARLLSDCFVSPGVRALLIPVLTSLALAEWNFFHPPQTAVAQTGFLSIEEGRWMLMLSGLLLVTGLLTLQREYLALKLGSQLRRIPVGVYVRNLTLAFFVLLFAINVPAIWEQVNKDDSQDLRTLAQWMNENTQPSDLVAVPPTVGYLMKPGVIPLEPEFVFHYNTGIATIRFPRPIPLTIEPTLDRIKYIVIETTFTGPFGPPAAPFVEQLQKTWRLAITIGDHDVYIKP